MTLFGNLSFTLSGGNIPACSSSSSSEDSIYNFKNPSNNNTSPSATKWNCLFLEIPILTSVFSNSAGDICEAMARFHINS